MNRNDYSTDLFQLKLILNEKENTVFVEAVTLHDI